MANDIPFVSRPLPASPVDSPSLWFVFRGTRLLVDMRVEPHVVPRVLSPADIGVSLERQQYLGGLGDAHCLAGEVDEAADPPPGYAFYGLRRLHDRMPAVQFQVAVRAVQLVAWDRDNQYCGRCQTPLELKAGERAKLCPACGLTRYPRISPAIIVAVHRDDRLLLARALRHPAGFYSVLAGFVEPGESLEDAVRREVREEVGVAVDDIRYFGSQPWPFPDSLMLAFTARYAGGELELEASEIAEAGWYAASELPATIPPPISIARALIDDFARRNGRY